MVRIGYPSEEFIFPVLLEILGLAVTRLFVSPLVTLWCYIPSSAPILKL